MMYCRQGPFFPDDIYHNQPQDLFVPNKQVRDEVGIKAAASSSTEMQHLTVALHFITFISCHSLLLLKSIGCQIKERKNIKVFWHSFIFCANSIQLSSITL